MATTAVFAELLVIGVQALIWMGLLLLTLAGPGLQEHALLGGLADAPALMALFVGSFAYVLGILIDRVADSLFHLVDDLFAEKALVDFAGKKLPGMGVMRTAVLQQGGGAADFLDYVRSRMRIMRASALNFPLIGWTVLLYGAVRTEDGAGIAAVALLMGGTGLGLLSAWAWYRIHRTYCRRLAQAWLRTDACRERDAAKLAKQAAKKPAKK